MLKFFYNGCDAHRERIQEIHQRYELTISAEQRAHKPAAHVMQPRLRTYTLPWRGVCSKRLIWILLRTLRGKLVWQLKLLSQIQQGKKTLFELNEIRRNGRYSLPLSQGATSRQSTAYGADKRLEFQLRSSSAVAPPPQRKDPELGKDRQNICITVAYREWRCCGYKM